MKNVFLLIGLGIILIACDQSIESRLQQIESNKTVSREKAEVETKIESSNATNSTVIEKPEVQTVKEDVVEEAKIEAIKPIIEDKKTQEVVKVEQEHKTDSNQPVRISEEIEQQITSNKKAQLLVKKESEKVATKNKTKKQSKDLSRTKVASTAKVPKESKQSVEKANNLVGSKENQYKSKNSRNDGTYDENGNLISNFTTEELRLGAQRSLTKDEIRFYKSLCRYAYMSDQDVSDYRCEAKKIRN